MKRLLAIIALLAMVTGAAIGADEITASITFKVVKGYLSLTRSVSDTHDLTATAPNVSGFTQSIGTNAHEQVDLGDVSTAGWSWFRNLGSNVIAIGVQGATTNFIEFSRLSSGEYGLIPLGTSAIYAQSIGTNEAATVLEKIIVDE